MPPAPPRSPRPAEPGGRGEAAEAPQRPGVLQGRGRRRGVAGAPPPGGGRGGGCRAASLAAPSAGARLPAHPPPAAPRGARTPGQPATSRRLKKPSAAGFCGEARARPVPRMLALRLLNVVAPAYFLGLSLVTLALQLFLFLPSLRPDPASAPLLPPALLHGALFLFLSTNALGNYVLVVQNSPDELDACGGALRAPPSTHFCRVCARVALRHDHHCFFTGNCIGGRNLRNFVLFCLYTSLACLHSAAAGLAYISAVLTVSFAHPLAFLTLLPTAIGQFFSGAVLGSEMLVILMLHLWLAVGLACAGFCCHQLLLILRGQTRHQARRGVAGGARPWRKNLQEVFGKRWLLGLLVPVVNVGGDGSRPWDK
ncbi:palmitoyltransferase ZDHHC22 isoform X1 [Erinaceus europaeus]|uniref:Palmitoyltransferase n=1 Tax=Erinaceus europaeus TaxID=9365 RepID=A0ABM3WL62_ERIEU|nr:palmitoyltransferase ZDHHC22 isoform X1 [Erinaceus europaeus]